MAVKAQDQVTISVNVDLSSVEIYYKLQSSTLAPPAKPTTANPSDWTTTEPTYDGTSTNTLYSCQKTTLTNGIFMWSAVSKSTSYEAAKAAWNLAHSASQSSAALESLIGTMEAPYRQVEWVEFTGGNICCLDYRPGVNGAFGFEADFITYNAFNSGALAKIGATRESIESTIGFIFGARGNNASVADNYGPAYTFYALMTYASSGYMFDGGHRTIAKLYTDKRRQQCSLRNGIYTAPDGSTVNVGIPTYQPSNGCIYVSGSHYGGGTSKASFEGVSVTRIYSLKFYDDDTLAVNLIPAIRKSDGMTGLYDSVEGMFYPSYGMLVGDDVGDLGEIPSLSSEFGASDPVLYDLRTRDSRLITVESNNIKKLQDGQRISILLKHATVSETFAAAGITNTMYNPAASSNVFLAIRDSDGNLIADEAPVNYSSGTALTTHYGAGMTVQLEYHMNAVVGTTSLSRTWFCGSDYNTNTNDTARYVQYYNTFKAGEALVAHSIVGAHEDGYLYKIAGEGDYFILSYPLLWLNAALKVNATNYANLFTQTYDRNLKTTYPAFTDGVADAMVYLVGTIDGDVFTVYGTDASDFLTCEIPISQNGLFYIPIGKLGNQWNYASKPAYFNYQVATPVTIYAFVDGKFRQVTPTEIVATQRIYFRSNTAQSTWTMPSAWLTEDGNVYNQWTTKVPPLAASTASGETKYPYLYTCEQRKRLDGTIAYTPVLLDENTTVIDGGQIVTHSITANQIAANSITANEIDATNLQVTAANVTGQLTASQINTSGLTIGYSQISNPPSIPSKTSDLTNDSSFATTTQVSTAKSEAISSANSSTDTKLQSYSTTSEMNTAIGDVVDDESAARKAIYGTCSTTASTAAKVVACSNFELYTGCRISIKFSTANTAVAPTLNVNGTGAIAIWYNNASASAANPVLWGTNAVLPFVYDGSHWILDTKPPVYSVTCSTGAGTKAKAATYAGALVVSGTTVQVLFSTANTYVSNSVQFNLSGTGAADIYRDRLVTSTTNTLKWDANTVLTFVRNAQYWYLADNGTRTLSEDAAKTATNFLTTVDSTGLFVHRANDTNSGVKITDNVDIMRNGVSKLHIDDDSVDINDSNEQNIVSFVGTTEEPSEANAYQTIRDTSVVMGDSTLGTALFNARLVDGQATETTYEYKGTTATIEASRDIGEPVDLIARIVANVIKEYNTSRSAFDIISMLRMQSDYLDVTTRTGNQIKRVDMDSIQRLIGCRIDIAFNVLNVNGNSGGNMVFNWVKGGFKDSNYIVAFSRMSYQPSYDHVEFAVVSRTASSITIAYWNSASAAVNGLQVGVIGIDSRYGSILS